HRTPPLTSITYLHRTFFFICRPPPKPTLFPYTTLFRSARGRREGQRRGTAAAGGAQEADRGGPQRGAGDSGQGQDRLVAGRRDLDRKSTRLNSSHVAISYAVFCLKKKKRLKQQHYNTES